MSVSRYSLPDPKCRHKRTGTVVAGSPDGAHAAASVCSRPACIADAVAWAEAFTRLPARHVLDLPSGGAPPTLWEAS